MYDHKRSVFLIIGLSALFAITLLWYAKIPSKENHLASKVIRPATKYLIELGIDADRRDRVSIRDRMLKNARSIAALTQDSTALEVVSFLERNGGLARPSGKRLVLMEQPQIEPAVYITPFKSSDECVGVWEGLSPEQSPAGLFQFIDGYNGFLAIRSLQFSGIGEGLAVLHQGHLAKSILTAPKKSHDQDCSLDVASYEFQYRLTEKIGGHGYVQALAEKVESLKRLTDSQSDTLPGPHEMSVPFDQSLGPPASAQESDFRKQHFWMHAVFRYYTELDPIRSRTQKAQLVCSLLYARK